MRVQLSPLAVNPLSTLRFVVFDDGSSPISRSGKIVEEVASRDEGQVSYFLGS